MSDMARSDAQRFGRQKGTQTPNSSNRVNQKARVSLDQLCSLAPTPIRVDKLAARLKTYPNRNAAQFLESGFLFGFDLNYMGPRMPVDFPNLKSVEHNKEEAKKKIEKEVSLGRYVGPYEKRPLLNLRTSPIGLVPKKTQGEFRLIHHLSYPAGYSVNDFILEEACKVEYSKFDDAVDLVARMGKGTELAKEDIKSAFRLLPISPKDYELLGVKFESLYYIDRCLPMGIRCAPAYFETFSTFLEFCVRDKLGTDRLMHYMDDFLAVGAPIGGGLTCLEIIQEFRAVCKEVGVPLAHEKSEGPTTRLTFLGLEIDTVQMQVKVPVDKITALKQKIARALRKKSLTLREIQSLVGSLTFVCRAVKPGRAFLRRIIDVTRNEKKEDRVIPLPAGGLEDLTMWLSFLKDFNGVAIIQPDRWESDADLDLFTDASGEIGFGGYFQGKWFCGEWPAFVLSRNCSIAWKEMVPIVLAVLLWGPTLGGKRIRIHTDNMAVKSIVNKQTSNCPRIMTLVRIFVLECLKRDIVVKALHIGTKDNAIADSLSRLQMGRFRMLAPDAEAAQTPIPEIIWEI